ncbi:MAG: GFA family protein [Rhizobiaceae bacterium]|jgi:hypothetical protein|nr:GFA family protein [Rhizobiaceae bacterium]
MVETKGSCACGSIHWQVIGPMRDIIACHCSQCRKQSGLYFAATAAENSDLTISGDTLSWYVSSEGSQRGFCNVCGSALFWKQDGKTFTSIMAGSIDGPHDLKIGKHIHVSDKASFYEINDGLPQE